MEQPLYITILAAGQGKRMNSNLPKVLHLVNDVPMIVRIIEEVGKIDPYKIIIVVGKYHKIIKDTISKYTNQSNIIYTLQEIPLGTGDAVKSTIHLLPSDGINMIINGDNPMIKGETLREIYDSFIKSKKMLQITCIKLKDPTGNGRIIINEKGKFVKIIEEKDCNDEEKKINLINCGIYVADNSIIKTCVPKINNNNAQKEYYLTDIVELARSEVEIKLFVLDESKSIETINVNTREELDKLNNILKNNEPSQIPS